MSENTDPRQDSGMNEAKEIEYIFSNSDLSTEEIKKRVGELIDLMQEEAELQEQSIQEPVPENKGLE